MQLVEIKGFNELINNKPFFDQPVKNKQETYEKLIEMSKNDNYTSANLLDFPYHQNYYKPIGIDLSRQSNTSIHQQINFTGTLEDNDDATTFFASFLQEIISNIFSDSLISTE